jgi:hypothetical protein
MKLGEAGRAALPLLLQHIQQQVVPSQQQVVPRLSPVWAEPELETRWPMSWVDTASSGKQFAKKLTIKRHNH